MTMDVKINLPSINFFHSLGTNLSLLSYISSNSEKTMKNSITKKIAIFTVTGLTLLASACNTIEGVGQDLESAGDKAEEITKK